jgi:putative ABC transport system permease protein
MTHLRQTIRSLVHRPGFTALVVTTLAVAIGANSAIFSVLSGVVLQPLPYDEPSELVVIWESNPSQGLEQSTTSAATFVDWRERSEAFEAMAAYRYRGYTLNQDGVPRRIASVEASPGLFDLLGVPPLLGRTFNPDEEAPGNERLVVLSHGAWENRFGADPAVLGRAVPLDGEPHTLVGVMPRGFSFPPGDTEVEAWSPLTLDLENLLSRPHRMYNTVGRLSEGVREDRARTEMEAIAAELAREYPDSNEGWSVTLVPARDQLLGDTAATVWVLFGAVSLVLLIGCANVANLLLVRSAERGKSTAVSAAFGASPVHLIRHSLLEGVVLGSMGGLAGLLVAWGGASLLKSVLPQGFPRVEDIGIDPVVVGFTAGVAVLCSLIFSLAPALRTIRTDVASVLQDTSRGSSLGRRSRRLANVMVGAEVGLALVLMVAAGLLLRSYVRLTSVDPGYRTTDVVAVAIELPPARYGGPQQQQAFFTELMGGLRGLPGVEAVGAVSYLRHRPSGPRRSTGRCSRATSRPWASTWSRAGSWTSWTAPTGAGSPSSTRRWLGATSRTGVPLASPSTCPWPAAWRSWGWWRTSGTTGSQPGPTPRCSCPTVSFPCRPCTSWCTPGRTRALPSAPSGNASWRWTRSSRSPR